MLMDTVVLVLEMLATILTLVAAFYAFCVYRCFGHTSPGWKMVILAAGLISIHRLAVLAVGLELFPGAHANFQALSAVIFFLAGLSLFMAAYQIKNLTYKYRLVEWKKMNKADERMKRQKRKRSI